MTGRPLPCGFMYNSRSERVMPKYHVRTFGCQMNENDSEHIAGVLAATGAEKAANVEDADIIIVNTCAVRRKSEEKLYSYLGRLASLKKRRPRLIGVAGCVAQVQKDALLRNRPVIDFVIGPDNYLELPAILERAGAGPRLATGWAPGWREIGASGTARESAVSGYVTIMEGCDNFCAYCIVPFSRGREKYRPFTSILAEVRELAAAGYKEVQLLGQNVNSYRDPETNSGFASLLEAVAAVHGIAWVRFVTSHPKNFDGAAVAAMAANPKICRQLHLPLQSGSTAVLERMNRGYGREDYLRLVNRLREAMPEILVTTDIIVGFPGETEEDFAATCEVLRIVRFAGVFSFRYSPRPLTAAARRPDDVPHAVKQRRLIELQALQKSIQLETNRAFVGKEIDVLCTGPSPKGGGRFAGRTDGNLVVNFAADRPVIGEFVRVRVTGCGPYSLHAELV